MANKLYTHKQKFEIIVAKHKIVILTYISSGGEPQNRER